MSKLLQKSSDTWAWWPGSMCGSTQCLNAKINSLSSRTPRLSLSS